MDRRTVNPWMWQDKFGFSQGVEVSGHTRVLFCAGQASFDEQGVPVHAGDMHAQIGQAFDNLEAVLKKAGLGLGDVVRLNVYTTDVPAIIEAYGTVVERLAAADCKPASTLCGVASLAFPELLVEIEATAVA